MQHRRCLIVIPVAAALAGGLGLPAEAQQTYRLEGEQWAPQPEEATDAASAELRAARTAFAEERYKDARKRLDTWIETYDTHPRLPEALLLRADALVQMDRSWKALFDYERIIRFYPGSQQWHTALEREYEIARLYVRGRKRKFLGMRILPADLEGQELLIRVQERAPGSEIGERASLELADSYFQQREMISAAEAYDVFLLNYPDSDRREWAMLRLIEASIAQFKGPEYDQAGLIEARERILQYEREYPAAAEQIGSKALLIRADESLALRDLESAKWYRKRGDKVAAAYTYRRLIRDHPATAAARRAVQELGELGEPVVKPGGGEDNGGPLTPEDLDRGRPIPGDAGAADRPPTEPDRPAQDMDERLPPPTDPDLDAEERVDPEIGVPDDE